MIGEPYLYKMIFFSTNYLSKHKWKCDLCPTESLQKPDSDVWSAEVQGAEMSPETQVETSAPEC